MNSIISYSTNKSVTQVEYNTLQQAYDFFNGELFDGALPEVLVTLQHHANSYGYFSPQRFTAREGAGAVHELALNPDHFGRSDDGILATLVHEMCHVWQQEANGKSPSPGYHDREWAAKMKSVGLYPSTTGAPGGKETGQKVSHYIIEGGPFALAFAKLQTSGFKLRWHSRADRESRRKASSKTKFTCPACEQNTWAKPDALLICGVCYYEGGDIHVMEPRRH